MQHLSPVLMVGQNGQANPSFSLIFMLAIILVMWLFLIRPQAKKPNYKSNSATASRWEIKLLPLRVFMVA